LPTDIRLLNKSYNNIPVPVIQRYCFSALKVKALILLIFLVILGSCKERSVTSPTPQMEIDSRFWIRVLLLNNIENCTLKINSDFNIIEYSNLQTETKKYSFKKISEPINIQLTDGHIIIASQTFTNNQIIIFPENPFIFNLNGDNYRGKLKLIINPNYNSFDAINLVPPEPYLAGVVGAEMPDYWEPEALKAQVIAARTYCFYIKKRFGNNRTWDVSKTAANQVYLGLSAESTTVWNAVNQTTGMVLTCKQVTDDEDIFPAYYSSTCGGHTESSENVFGDFFEPLVGVPCPYCKDVAKPKFFFWPAVQFKKKDVSNRLLEKYPNLNRLGEIIDIAVANQSNYKEFTRLTKIQLIGSTGENEFLSCEDFRLTIDSTGRKLKSANFQIETWDDSWAFLSGRGWGHGVGMCQCGAEGMARKGKNAEQILSHYYPESKILKINYNK
jgi:stage II sporulation protein D